jgi:succinate-semialdehyde dehydrogenase / glutarate-semialdehyde dehydrogenase
MTILTELPGGLELQCYIGGAFVGGASEPVLNPANGALLGKVPWMGQEEAEAAVVAAAEAFAGSWPRLPAKERSRILRHWFDLIVADRERLASILTAEQGKPLSEALGEIDYAAGFVEFYAEECKRIAGEVLPGHRADARNLVIRQPTGVVACITPWNFPAAMVTRKVAPALAAGCTVVLKPAAETPLTAFALVRLAHEAGIPPGVINVLTGDAVAIGKVFTQHPAVKVVSFTGSTQVGRLLAAQAAPTIKKMALELGGNAPLIVFNDADLDTAVTGVMFAKFRNMGQTCVCANRIYVQSGIHDEFVERLGRAIAALKVGDGLEAGTEQGPLITERAVAKVSSHVEDALARGARLQTGGHALGGTFFEPTLLVDATADMLIAREETFGPIAAVFRFDSEDEAIRQANDTEFGLAAYLFSRDMSRIWRVTEALEYGMVGVNTAAISTELAPFGGIKQSGHSREGAHHGIDEFLDIKYVSLAIDPEQRDHI